MSKTILFATDYSAGSEKVLELATNLARAEDAKLLIVHVTMLERTPVGEHVDEMPEPNPAEMERLRAVVPPDPDVPFEQRLLYGEPGSVKVTNPADEMLNLVNEEQVDLIVLGTHGRTGLTRLLMGSVAETLLRNSPCPVLVVKLPETATRTIKDRHLDRPSIEALNHLVVEQRYSLATYLRTGHQWTHPGDEALVKAIHEIGLEHEQNAERIARVLSDCVGQVPHGQFPMEFTEHDDIALDYLVPELIRHERQMVEQVEHALGKVGTQPELFELVEALLKTERRHVKTLTELQGTLRDSQ